MGAQAQDDQSRKATKESTTDGHHAREKVFADRSRSHRDRQVLVSVMRMEQLQAHGMEGIAGFTYKVDARGIIIFRLPGGGVIKDTGREILWNANAAARNVGMALQGMNVHKRVTAKVHAMGRG